MSLIAWYPLNGDTLDYSGNGRHATNSGAIINNNGKIGKCYEFDDNRSIRYVENIDLKGDISFSIWVFPTSIPTLGGLISNHKHSSTPANFSMYLQTSGKVTVATGNVDGTRGGRITSNTVIPLNSWTHISFTYSHSKGVMKLYVDGKLDMSTSSSLPINFTPYPIIIGQWAYSHLNNYEFRGKLNDARIYDHALSTKEVKEIAKAKILHHKFDDPDATTIVRDCSGFGNDGVINPSTAPTWTSDSKIGGGAYEFNGNSIITTKQLFTDNVNQCHTVSAWVYPTSPSNSSNQQLVDFNSGYRLYHTANGQSLMYMNSGINDHYVYGSTIPANKWTMVTWVYDKVNLICRVYYDGNLNASSGNFTSSDIPRGFSTSTIFGSNFVGLIDDIRIYATALSADDIKELYEQRASIDDKGKLFLQDISETKFTPLLMDYTNWEVGQTGSIGKFGQYSSSNSRILAADPWGKETVVWQSKTNGGIYHSAIPIDNTKTYRMSWWEKRVVNTGTSRYYAGLNGYGSVNGVGNLTNTTPNTNPYFWNTSQNGLSVGEWFLIVGHVHPHNYTGSTSLESGRYTVNGRIGGISTDYRWLPQTTSARSRTLSVYQGSVPEITHYTVYPRMDICDGTEPSITELLHGFDSRYIEKVRLKKNGVIGLDIGDNLTHIGEIREVGIPIRYIRDTVSGSTANSSNHWVEIQAYDTNEVNIALGKSASSSLLTDGSSTSSPYYSGGPATVDLGSVEIVNYLKIWHYWADGRTYHDIKTEVSVDNVNWITVFDSNIDGEYKETSSGKTIILRPNELSIDSKGNLFINEISEV